MTKPVLLLLFNRPEYTRHVIKSLELYKPTTLYVSIDGPRDEKDMQNIEKCKKLIDNLSWQPKIYKKYNTKNLGCGLGVSTAISWAFENEQELIIIEDDIVATKEFFELSDQLLDKYRHSDDIFMIAGTNYLSANTPTSSLLKSKNATIWGWATWKTRWEKYCYEIPNINNKDLRQLTGNHSSWIRRRHMKRTLKLITNKMIDTWDIQWMYAMAYNSGYAITPNKNLVTNIGEIGVHSSRVTDSHYLNTYDFNVAQAINSELIPGTAYDKALEKKKIYKAEVTASLVEVLKYMKLYRIIRFVVQLIRRCA